MSNSFLNSIYFALSVLISFTSSLEILSSSRRSILLISSSFTDFNKPLFSIISFFIVSILLINSLFIFILTTPGWLSDSCLIISLTQSVLLEDSSWNVLKSAINAFFNSSHVSCTVLNV